MRSAAELKRVLQEGWNIPARIDNYVRHIGEFTEGESHDAWRETLAGVLEADRRLRILDVGTGPGTFACLYAQLGHEAIGLDFSERMLAVARGRAADLRLDCTFLYGDAEDPPLSDASFDFVSCRHLLFTLPRPGAAMRQWARVLRPGGRLILIGDESSTHDALPPAACGRRVANWLRHRRFQCQVGNRSAGPDYVNAVSECPLFRHDTGTLRTLMEAVGLVDIHPHPTDAIQAARRKLPRSQTGWGFASAPPFILVGAKPDRA